MDNDIRQLIEISNQRILSSQENKALLVYLKSISEEEAYEILKDMVERKSFITLEIVKKVLNERVFVTRLFQQGLSKSNAQSIELWLDFAISKLGFESAIKIIEKLNSETNMLAEKAIYWLPKFIGNNTKYQNLLNNLKERVKSNKIPVAWQE